MNPLVYGICIVNESSISGKESLESGKESKFGKESNGKESKCKCSETSYVTLAREQKNTMVNQEKPDPAISYNSHIIFLA